MGRGKTSEGQGVPKHPVYGVAITPYVRATWCVTRRNEIVLVDSLHSPTCPLDSLFFRACDYAAEDDTECIELTRLVFVDACQTEYDLLRTISIRYTYDNGH